MKERKFMIAMDTFVYRQSPSIAVAAEASKERREGVFDNQMDWFQGAGDQGVMIGYSGLVIFSITGYLNNSS